MGVAPLTRAHSKFHFFTVATLVTDVFFEQFLIHTAVKQAEHGCHRYVMDTTLSDNY